VPLRSISAERQSEKEIVVRERLGEGRAHHGCSWKRQGMWRDPHRDPMRTMNCLDHSRSGGFDRTREKTERQRQERATSNAVRSFSPPQCPSDCCDGYALVLMARPLVKMTSSAVMVISAQCLQNNMIRETQGEIQVEERPYLELP
jgi:hypothetical protein